MKNFTVNFGNLTDTQKSFLSLYFNERSLDFKVQQQIEAFLAHAAEKGYTKDDCKIVLDYPKVESMHKDSMKTNYSGFFLRVDVDGAYEMSQRIEDTGNISYNSSTFSKQLNNYGKLLKAQAEIIINQDKKAKEEREEQLRDDNKKKEEDAQKAKEANEQKIKNWIETNGSELLKNRVALGFDYKCLAKTEYSKFVLGVDTIVKFADFTWNEDVINRPTLEQMEYVKIWDKKIEGLGKRHSLYEGKTKDDVWVNITVDVPSFYGHDVMVKL